MNMPLCENCTNPVQPSLKFCSNCGSPIGTINFFIAGAKVATIPRPSGGLSDQNKPIQPTPNDQKSDAHNPTSKEYRVNANNHGNQSNPGSVANKAAMDNRSNQMNPLHHGSKGKK